MTNRFQEKTYYVYILTNRSGGLYTGITSELEKRVWDHKTGVVPGFASTYKMNRLLYFEETTDVLAAIEREKQIKSWRRSKKIALIHSMNPRWLDLTETWADPREPRE